MTAYEFLQSTRFRDREAQRLSRTAHVGAGVLYAAALALTVWGYDAILLARYAVESPWAKLAIGAPAMLGIGLLAGLAAGRRHHAALSIVAWIVSGFLLGLVAGWIPYGGPTLAAWLTEPRLRGVALYPMGAAGYTRMWFMATVTGAVGAAIGLLIHLLVEKAWDLAKPEGVMSARSWLVLLACTPLAVLPGIACDDIVNSDLRYAPQAVHSLIAEPAGEATSISEASISSYRGQMEGPFTLHRVASDLELSDATLDAAFLNGLVVRCTVLGDIVTGCQPISIRQEEWMHALLSDARSDGDRSQLAGHANRLSVDPGVVAWVAAQRSRTGGSVEISRDAQRGGWVIMDARFGASAIMECYFHGSSPVILDHCQWQR